MFSCCRGLLWRIRDFAPLLSVFFFVFCQSLEDEVSPNTLICLSDDRPGSSVTGCQGVRCDQGVLPVDRLDVRRVLHQSLIEDSVVIQWCTLVDCCTLLKGGRSRNSRSAGSHSLFCFPSDAVDDQSDLLSTYVLGSRSPHVVCIPPIVCDVLRRVRALLCALSYVSTCLVSP